MANLSDMIHGRKPEVAPFIPTDPIEMLKQLLSGEIKDWPQIEQLGNLYQIYMMQSLDKVVPGFSDILKQGGIDTESILKSAQPLTEGKIPQDLSDMVMRHAAFSSLGAGTLGGPMGMALSARDLGLTGLDVMKQGAGLTDIGTNAAQRWQQIANGTILPPSSQLYSPEWFTEFDAKQKAAKQATKQFKFNTDAAPDPAMADRAKMLASLLGSFAGPGGATMGQYASGTYAQNFNQMPVMNDQGSQGEMGSAFYNNMGAPSQWGTPGGQPSGGAASNPGFFTNFGTAAGGGQSVGMGGWLGSLFNQGGGG